MESMEKATSQSKGSRWTNGGLSRGLLKLANVVPHGILHCGAYSARHKHVF
jgi:hypothetical protein